MLLYYPVSFNYFYDDKRENAKHLFIQPVYLTNYDTLKNVLLILNKDRDSIFYSYQHIDAPYSRLDRIPELRYSKDNEISLSKLDNDEIWQVIVKAFIIIKMMGSWVYYDSLDNCKKMRISVKDNQETLADLYSDFRFKEYKDRKIVITVNAIVHDIMKRDKNGTFYLEYYPGEIDQYSIKKSARYNGRWPWYDTSRSMEVRYKAKLNIIIKNPHFFDYESPEIEVEWEPDLESIKYDNCADNVIGYIYVLSIKEDIKLRDYEEMIKVMLQHKGYYNKLDFVEQDRFDQLIDILRNTYNLLIVKDNTIHSYDFIDHVYPNDDKSSTIFIFIPEAYLLDVIESRSIHRWLEDNINRYKIIGIVEWFAQDWCWDDETNEK